MRGRLRHSSAHTSPARGEWLTVRALPAILSAARWCLIVALSLCTSGSECKVMLKTVQQPKVLNTMQAARPPSSVAPVWLQTAFRHSSHQTRPFPIVAFIPLKLEPSDSPQRSYLFRHVFSSGFSAWPPMHPEPPALVAVTNCKEFWIGFGFFGEIQGSGHGQHITGFCAYW